MSEGRRWTTAFCFCAALSALPFLTTYRVPMNDLPQHAAQIAIWKSFDAPCYRFAETYEINYLTPYLVGYSIARAAAAFMSVNTALKFTAWLTVLALPLVLRLLARRSGLDPWIALIGFPLAFGFSFYWGFLNFLVALPFGLLLIYVQEEYLDRPRTSTAVIVGALGLLLVACHAVAFAVFAGIAGLLLLARWRSARAFAAGLIPLAIPALALMTWIQHVGAQTERARTATVWGVNLDRVISFPGLLLSAAPDVQASLMAVVLTVAALLAGVRPSRDWKRWIPAGAAAAAYLLIPLSILGQVFMHARFAVVAIAFVILGLDARDPLLRRGTIRALIAGTACIWMLVLAARFHGFDREASGFDRVAGVIPANRSVLLLNVISQSEWIPGSPFLHLAGYYQERKGGVNAWSFANNFPSLIRYRSGASVPRVAPVVSYDPRTFGWEAARGVDWFIVHAPGDMRPLLFGPHAEEVLLRARSGDWWLYGRAGQTSADCVPLESDAAERKAVLRW